MICRDEDEALGWCEFMDLKPRDVFLTITSFFAILLPGAIMVMLLLVAGWSNLFPALPTTLGGSIGPWLVYLLASYLAGQLLYALGSWLLDPIYDWMRLGFKHPERGVRLQTLEASLRRDVFGGRPGSILPKTRAYILAREPQAWIAVEQADADSKFFRAATVVAAWGVPAALITEKGWQVGACALATALIVASSLVFRLVSCRNIAAGKGVGEEIRGTASIERKRESVLSETWAQLDAWLCANTPPWLTFGNGVLLVCMMWLAVSILFNFASGIIGIRGSTQQWAITLAAAWGLMLVSFFRYNGRRADRDKTALEATVELAGASLGKK
jgi:hypothetical protein